MNLPGWLRSVWYRITGFRESGSHPREVEPDDPSDAGPESVEPDESSDDVGLEPVELDEPSDDEPEPVETDEPPGDGSESTEPDEPSDAGPEPTEPDEPPDAGPEPTEPHKPSDDANSEPTEPHESSDDVGPETTEPDEPSDAGPEPTEPDEPSDDMPEPVEPDEPSDAGPAPTEPDEPSDDMPEPVEPDEPSDAGPEPTEPDELAEGGLSGDRSQDTTGPAEHKRKPGRGPRNIRGRREASTSPPNEPSGGRRTFKPKPELICRRSPIDSWQWDMILSIPQECNVARVSHGDHELTAKNSEYCLTSFSGSLAIEYGDGTNDEMSLVGDAPLIFKLRNEWQGDGRRISGITRGHFVVVAPSKWTRKGSAPVSPESCTDTDYTAHFFFIDQDDETGGFEEHPLSLTQTGFVLEGERLHDDSEDGDLFVGDALTLKPAEGIVWARVGGEATNAWPGENFNPADRTLGGVLGNRQGRFYIRVYDESVSLADSGEFRYCADLQEIRVKGESYSQDMLLAPSLDGHSEATLQFVDVQGATIQPKLKVENPHVDVAPDGTALLAPHPECDETTWLLAPNGSVEVVIRLPRVWWRIVRPNAGPGCWCDKAFSMSRDEFREQAEAEVQIRVPSSIKNVRAGFGSGKDLDQSFRVEHGLRQVSLPLNAFVDYEQIDEASTDEVSLNIRCSDVEIVLMHIIPDPPPPVPEPPQPEPEPPQPEPELPQSEPEPPQPEPEPPQPEPESPQPDPESPQPDPESPQPEPEPPQPEPESPQPEPEPPQPEPEPPQPEPEPPQPEPEPPQPEPEPPQPEPAEPPQVPERSAYVKRPDGSLRYGKGFSRRELQAVGMTNADAARLSIPTDLRRRTAHRANIEALDEVKELCLIRAR